MITYQGVTYHVDEEAGIAYFFNESRMGFCKDCPIKSGETLRDKDGVEVIAHVKCPCPTMVNIASASISKESFDDLRAAGLFEEFVESVLLRDLAIGGGEDPIKPR